MKTYELHTYLKGVWKIDSMFDDPEIAIEEAKRVEESRRYSGIRVIEEVYDQDKNRTSTRTIFRGGVVNELKKDRKAVTGKPVASGPHFGTGKEPVPRVKSRVKGKAGSLLGPVLILTFCVIVGLFALFGLRQLAQMG